MTGGNVSECTDELAYMYAQQHQGDGPHEKGMESSH